MVVEDGEEEEEQWGLKLSGGKAKAMPTRSYGVLVFPLATGK